MTAVVLLFVIGVFLLGIEIVVPGGILGVFGALALGAGIFLAFREFGSVGGATATGIAFVIGGCALYLEFVLLPKTRLARKFSMTETVAGRSQPEIADRSSVVGKEVIAATTLAPSGYVELEGRRYEAFCRSGHAAIGSRLRVDDVDTFRLVVTSIPKST